MDKRYFIELTNKLYRLTLSFPKQESLRQRIRGLANEVLMDLVIILEGDEKGKRESAFNVEKNIALMDTCFELSKNQDWAEKEEISGIQKDYLEIKKEVEEVNNTNRMETTEEEKRETVKKPTVPLIKKREKALNKRQEKILNLLKKKEKVQVKDIQEVLPEATKRTLRRDLSDLTEQGNLRKVGRGNMTYYELR